MRIAACVLGGLLVTVMGCADDSDEAASTVPSTGSLHADAGDSPGLDAATSAVTHLDGPSDRFYVANTESDSISIIDHRTVEVIETVELGNKPHGQAPTNDGRRIYVTTDGGDGEVIAIDTADNSVAWRIDVGSDLNEPHLTRDERFLYVPDLLAATVFVVDVDTRDVVAEVAMVDEQGANLVALHNTYASHDGTAMFVTAILSNTIARIDPATHEINRLYPLSGEPRPAAISEDDSKMYVQLSELHGFIELDLESGDETAKIEWPEPDPLPDDYLAYSGLPTKCHGIGISPDGAELWAATNIEGAVYVYSLPELEQLARIDVGDWPNWVAFSRDGSTVYVTNSEVLADHGTVSVIDRAERRVETTLDVGAVPKRIHRVELPEP